MHYAAEEIPTTAALQIKEYAESIAGRERLAVEALPGL